MLTLQQLLESDSLATIVAKLNQNFQSLSLSNGGPQGIIGKQGIPGLPGRVGPMGSTGPMGPTGTITGIIPFAAIPGTGTTAGPTGTITEVDAYGTVGPWPQSSWQWLKNYHSNGISIYGVPQVGGQTPKGGDIYIDHANKGYWKFLNQPDEPGAHDDTAIPPYTDGGAYSSNGLGSTYPALGSQLGWVGAGWYYYPPGNTEAESLNNVWIQDTSTYLLSNLGGALGITGPYKVGPIKPNNNTLKIPNARLLTKYGTIWITSGNDPLDTQSDANITTSTIGEWGIGSGSSKAQPARNNAGIDRLLFKMSLDGLPYLSNIAARGLLPADTVSLYPDSTYPSDTVGNQMATNNYWVSPMYGVSLDKYSPLLFLTQRDELDTATEGTYGSLGVYMITATDNKAPLSEVPNIPPNQYGNGTQVQNNNISKTIHLFSGRYSIDPLSMYYGAGTTPIKSTSTKNYGEMVLDFRRVVASNQYVCSLPTDLKLSSDYLAGTAPAAGTIDTRYYDEKNSANSNFRYKSNQGYISAINGKAMTGNKNTADYWEYGLGSNSPSGDLGTHDAVSGTLGMRTRRSWYGSSVLKDKPSLWLSSAVDTTDYIRVAGMMERGRRTKYNFEDGGYSQTAFLSELIFYSSAFSLNTSSLAAGGGVTNDLVNPSDNAHKSMPSLYVSPYTNIGIGTFVGGYLASNDQGPQEPAAKLHVHLKETTASTDPSVTYDMLPAGSGVYSPIPRKTFSVAAFTGDVDPTVVKGNIDILIGALSSLLVEPVASFETPANLMRPIGVGNQLRNAIRSESWATQNVSTLRFGAQPYSAVRSIGKTDVNAFRNEFQIALHPLTVRPTDNVSLAGRNLANSLTSITGVGIHNMYPRARVHFFGTNTNNEIENGVQAWRPGYMSSTLGATYPYYGAPSINSASANQVVIDYIGDSYKYPVGLYEYQYYAYDMFSDSPGIYGDSSPNAAVYPNRDSLSPSRYAVPYGSNQYYNQSYPSTLPTVEFNNSYKHGGTENAWWEPSSFIGFNLYRDLSSADGNLLGDNRDTTTWILGTQGTDGRNHGNNGGAGIISSNTGELGIITIPRGRDGGRAYEEWEQRGLGTRDVLNHMKIVFDKNGNIAIGNAAGWDLDAYPSTNMNIGTGHVNYLSVISGATNALNAGPFNAFNTLSSRNRFGNVEYYSLSSIYQETPGISSAALINKRATVPEYIRLEVGAEKAWSRDGRMAQKLGFGYPANTTITIPSYLLSKYIRNSYSIATDSSTFPPTWVLSTDAEGRIINNTFTFRIPPTSISGAPTPTPSNFVVVFPHPSEFSDGGPLSSLVSFSFTAPIGAIAAEWWGMSTDSPVINSGVLTTQGIFTGVLRSGWTISFVPTTDARGSANVRLNNFVYGEGFGFSTDTQEATGLPRPFIETEYTKNLVRQKRQESPKLIFTFLEKTPNEYEASQRPSSGSDPYLKVSTIISSAQNESAMREYWIPKTDNTGGTFMVFTDHYGKKEKETGFDDESIAITTRSQFDSTRVGLHLEEVVTQEFLANYSPGTSGQNIDADIIQNQSYLEKNDALLPTNMYPGYVRYYNRSYNMIGQPEVFNASTYGQLVDSAPAVTIATGSGISVTTGVTPKTPPRSTFRIASVGGEVPTLNMEFSLARGLYGVLGNVTAAGGGNNCTSGDHTKYVDWANQTSFYLLTNVAVPGLPTVFQPTVSASASGNAASWWSDSLHKITIGDSGDYQLTIDYDKASNNTATPQPTSTGCPSVSSPGWKVYQPQNKTVLWNSTLTVYLLKNNAIIATLGSTDTIALLGLSTGDVLELIVDYSITGNSETASPTKCDCSQLRQAALEGFYFSTTNGTLTLQKGSGGGCDLTPKDSIVQMAMGRTQIFGYTMLVTPDDDAFVCPSHTFVNIDDNYVPTGGLAGSVVSVNMANPRNVVFNRSAAIIPSYDKVKIKINFSGRTPNLDDFYDNTYRALLMRFLPSSGGIGSNGRPPGNFRRGDFLNGSNLYVETPSAAQSPNSVIYAVFPGKATVGNAYLYEGYAELYISKATWESSPSWVLCSGFWKKDPQPISEVTDISNVDLGQDENYDAWEIDKLSIEFELITTETINNTVNNTLTDNIDSTATYSARSSIRRNIDKFYDIFDPATNYDNGWNTVGTDTMPTINNPASSIRMKRINSEFALVDFNITVEVKNPYIGETAKDSLIDFGSPRFTQYMRFTYIPDEAFFDQANYQQDIAQDLFGNGMWFSNWSSYKNWLPGTAIVGDDINNGNWGDLGNRDNYNGAEVGWQRRNVASDWSPTFNDTNLGSNTGRPILRTWNGNLLEMLSIKNRFNWEELSVLRGTANYGILTNPLAGISGGGSINKSIGTGVFSAFGDSGAMLKMAERVFNYSSSSSNAEFPQKQKAFMGFLGAMHAMWGNQAFERNTNTQWRMAPAYNYIDESTAGSANFTNNGFTLEIQFSKPILHVDTPLGASVYGVVESSSDTVQPYKYLTVSGQGIVRYAQTQR